MKILLVFFFSFMMLLPNANGFTSDEIMNQVDSLNIQADSLRKLHNFCEEAIKKVDLAIEMADKNSYKKGLADAYIQKGRAQKCIGEFVNAEESYRKALSIRKNQLKDTCGVAKIYNNLSSLVDSPEDALSFSKKAILSVKDTNCGVYLEAKLLNNLANNYSELGQLDSAIYFLIKSNSLFSVSKDTLTRIRSGYNLAKSYLSRNQFQKAEKEFDFTLGLTESFDQNNNMLLGQLNEGKGLINLFKNKPDKALIFFEIAEDIYRNIPFSDEALSNVYFNIGDIYESIEKFDLAKKAYEKCEELAYIDSDIRYLAVSRVELVEIKKEKAKRQKYFNILLMSLLLISTSMAFLTYLLFRKEQTNGKLREDNHKLKHDIVKNSLLVIDNCIENNFNENSKIELPNSCLLEVRKKVRRLLIRLGYLQYNDDRKNTLKAFIHEMHSIACEASLMQVDNYTDFYSIEDYKISKKFMNEMEAIITEAFTNIKKNAQCDKASMLFELDDNGLAITIEDNGLGFEPESVSKSGLHNMKTRVENLNGRLIISSIKNEGTNLKIEIFQFPEEIN